MHLFAGRMGRRAFLAAYICLVVAEAAILLATGSELVADVLSLLPWLWIASKRLHDFNARWWWALIPLAVGFASGFVKGFSEAAAHAAELTVLNATTTGADIGWAAAAQRPWAFAKGFVQGFYGAVAARAAANPILFCLDTAFLFVLLLWPGTRGPNRFGDPPGRIAVTSN
jgi:uncharacterized membrane protein YhaH (DUF805 family)